MKKPKLTLKTEDEEINVPLNTDISNNVLPALSVNTSVTWHDPVAEKLQELEERIDAWQNKFEFVNVREK